MNIETRIRKIAGSKIRVKITKKRRSKGGFIIKHPSGFVSDPIPSRRDALNQLLVLIRCQTTDEWKLEPAKKGRP